MQGRVLQEVGAREVGKAPRPLDGGMISRMGAAGIAQACWEKDVTVYACGEEHKFVAQMPSWNEIGFEQPIVDFTAEKPQAPPEEPVEWVVSSSLPERLLVAGY